MQSIVVGAAANGRPEACGSCADLAQCTVLGILERPSPVRPLVLTQAPTRATVYAQPQPPVPRDGADDLSGHPHRQVIGYLGLALPVLLVQAERLRPNAPEDQWMGDSISAYYWTGAVSLFAGLLAALSLFLLTYRGYANAYRKYDRAAAIVAGVAAALVALFPITRPPGARPPWWEPWIGIVHVAAAVTLFSMFAVFSLWLFRKTEPDGARTADEEKEKRLRNRIFLVCGIGIVASMGWALVAGNADQSIFWPESAALVFFAWSWLTKGRALRSIKRTASAVKTKATPQSR
jgi:hypothetical protein